MRVQVFLEGSTEGRPDPGHAPFGSAWEEPTVFDDPEGPCGWDRLVVSWDRHVSASEVLGVVLSGRPFEEYRRRPGDHQQDPVTSVLGLALC